MHALWGSSLFRKGPILDLKLKMQKKMQKKNQKLFFVPEVTGSENVAISCFW